MTCSLRAHVPSDYTFRVEGFRPPGTIPLPRILWIVTEATALPDQKALLIYIPHVHEGVVRNNIFCFFTKC